MAPPFRFPPPGFLLLAIVLRLLLLPFLLAFLFLPTSYVAKRSARRAAVFAVHAGSTCVARSHRGAGGVSLVPE